MRTHRRKGLVLSALLHLTILLFAIFGLPSILDHTPPAEPAAITVELLPLMDTTNVKPAETTPTPEKKEEKKEEKKPTPPVKVEDKPEPKKSAPPVKTAQDTPPPPEKPAEKKDLPKEKPPEPKKEEKKNKAKEEDLAAVLKAVRETARKQQPNETPAEDKQQSSSESKSTSQTYDPTKALSMTEQDAIRSQIMKCWNVAPGAKNAHELIVVLRIQLEQDGSLIQVTLANESKARYSSDSFFRAAADSAMRAVRQCTPLKNLPPEKYQNWRDIELKFDPTEMLL